MPDVYERIATALETLAHEADVRREAEARRARDARSLERDMLTHATAIGRVLAERLARDPIEQLDLEPIQLIHILQVLRPDQRETMRPSVDAFVRRLSSEELDAIASVGAVADLFGIPRKEAKP